MKLGIGSWTYPWSVGVPGYERPARPLTAFGLLERAKALGAGVVQICDNIQLETWSNGSLAELAAAAEQMGLELQTGTRGVSPAHLLLHLEIAQRLGAKLIRTLTDTSDCKPEIPAVAGMVREAAPAFEKAGICLAIENHDRFSSAELANLIESIGSHNVGICLDTANCFGALERPNDIVDVLAPYTVNLHIKDFGISRIENKMGFLIIGRPAGSGMLDVDRILGSLAAAGRSPDAILEQWPPYLGTVEQSIETECRWAEQGAAFLNRKLEGCSAL